MHDNHRRFSILLHFCISGVSCEPGVPGTGIMSSRDSVADGRVVPFNGFGRLTIETVQVHEIPQGHTVFDGILRYPTSTASTYDFSPSFCSAPFSGMGWSTQKV